MLPTLLISSANEKDKITEEMDGGIGHHAGNNINNNDLLHID